MKKYSIIYADPPWAYRTYSKKGQGRSAESHYPTMCIEDIKALPVGELAAKDCALFWINDNICRWQQLFAVFHRHFVMIRQYNRHPKFFGCLDRLSCRDSVVAGDDRINSLLFRLSDHIIADPITIFLPMWKPKADISP